MSADQCVNARPQSRIVTAGAVEVGRPLGGGGPLQGGVQNLNFPVWLGFHSIFDELYRSSQVNEI